MGSEWCRETSSWSNSHYSTRASIILLGNSGKINFLILIRKLMTQNLFFEADPIVALINSYVQYLTGKNRFGDKNVGILAITFTIPASFRIAALRLKQARIHQTKR